LGVRSKRQTERRNSKERKKRIVGAVHSLYDKISKVGDLIENVGPYIESDNYCVASKTIIGMMESLNTADNLLDIIRNDMDE